MKKAFIMLAAILALTPAVAQADVTLNMSVGQLLQNDGSSPLATNSTLALFADTGNDGFGDFTQGSTGWNDDPNDVLLSLFPSNDFLAGPGSGSSFDALTFGFDGLSAGDPLQLVWYDLPFDVGLTNPGDGVFFGTFRSDDPQDGANIGWFVPNDGATVSINFITDSFGGSNPASSGVAQFQTQVVPEPISAVLGLIGGTAMLARRKFNRSNLTNQTC